MVRCPETEMCQQMEWQKEGVLTVHRATGGRKALRERSQQEAISLTFSLKVLKCVAQQFYF